MKTTKRNIFFASLIFMVTACASDGEGPSLVTACEFSDGSDAPSWTCNEDVLLDIPQLRGVTWATGQAKKMRAGKSLQKKAAILDGRGKLLEQISVRVESLLQQQVQGVNAEDAVEQFIQSFSEGILAGSRAYSTAIDPESGEMFVIVGINDDQFKENIAANKQYQEFRDAILAGGGGAAAARRIDSGLDRISEAKKTMGLAGVRDIVEEGLE